MLRNRLPDAQSEYADVTRGVNLRKSLEDLRPGEAELLQNCYYDSDLRQRFGCLRYTSASLGAFQVVGGHKAYFGDATGRRLVAGGGFLFGISDTGIVSTLSSTLTAAANTFFSDWSITDRSYVVDGTTPLHFLDSAGVFSTLSGTNIPASPTMVVPFSDRIFVIQNNVVLPCNPRDDSIWASTGSSWSAYRGIGGSGNPTAIGLHSASGTPGDPQAQLLIFQRNTLTALVGTDFGSDVTLASPPSTWDAQLILLDPRTGTSSPYSVCNVPGVGTFWFTSEKNVAWLPIGSSIPRLIGNSLYSYRAGILGVNDAEQTQLAQVLMIYHDLKLKLYLPVQGNNYTTIQYWLDMRPLMENLASVLTQPSENIPAAWSGPHIGQSIRRVWIENQSGDAERLMGVEGNQSNGQVVYELNPLNYDKDDVGPATTTAINYHYKGNYFDYGAPGYLKYLYDLLIDTQGFINMATVTVNDLHATLTSGLSIMKMNGGAFTNITYGTGFRYGNGTLYGQASANNLGHVNYAARSGVVPAGDALQIEVQKSSGNYFAINRILPQVRIQKNQPIQ